MTNNEKYQQAFAEAFEAEPEETVNFKFRETEGWDSIGHMSLIASLEDAFGVEFEPEEILTITTYQTGKDALTRKGIVFE